MLDPGANSDSLAINEVIFEELGIRYERIEDLNELLPRDYYLRTALPWEAAFFAGKAFWADTKRKALKRSTLPDFVIGVHAAVAGMR